MPTLSATSLARINASHPLLQKLWMACAADPACPPFMMLDAQRGRQAQERAFALGHSRAHFGQSAHNWSPAVADDVVPYPVDWNNLDRFRKLAAFVKAKASKLGIPIVWGGDWPKLKDMPHYELSSWRELVRLGKVKPFQG
jgi:peptidoglycan L-alanyl-D-glutamate endopeptidase CwlK